MKLDMQEELNTVNHSRSNSTMNKTALLKLLALGAAIQPLPQHKPDQVKPNGLTGKQWNRRKQRSKMARKSRKANRKGA